MTILRVASEYLSNPPFRLGAMAHQGFELGVGNKQERLVGYED